MNEIWQGMAVCYLAYLPLKSTVTHRSFALQNSRRVHKTKYSFFWRNAKAKVSSMPVPGRLTRLALTAAPCCQGRNHGSEVTGDQLWAETWPESKQILKVTRNLLAAQYTSHRCTLYIPRYMPVHYITWKL